MSDKTPEEIEHDREQLVRSLGMGDLSMLTDSQMSMIQRVQLQRMNERARERMEKALEGKEEAVATALTQSPFVFTCPPVRVMAGCVVRFSSLMTAQLRDAHRQLDTFISTENPNDIRMSDFLNRYLLAHSLVQFNEEDFGGVSFDADDFQGLKNADREKADKMLSEVREQRLQALDNLSPHLVQRLVEYYQAFQLTIESMTKGEDMDDTLGN
jgi:hypothetical protein